MYSRLTGFAGLWMTAVILALPASSRAEDRTSVETTAPQPITDDPRTPTASGTKLDLDDPFAGGKDLAETLAEVPGVQVRHTSFGQPAFATIRGSNARQVHVEWEGLRLNPPFGPGYDLGGTSMLGFDEVVVWRGAAATYRGSGAVSGVLEFRTRHRRQPGVLMRATGLGGSFDTLAASLDVDVADEHVSNRVGLAARRSAGDFRFVDAQGESAVRTNNDHERLAAFASSELRYGKSTIRTTALVDGGERGTPGQSEFQNRFDRARLKDRHVLGLTRVERVDLIPPVAGWAFDGFGVAGLQFRDVGYRNPDPFFGGEPIETEADATSLSAKMGATAWGPSSVARVETSARRETWVDEAVDTARATAGVGAGWEQRLARDRVVVFGSGRFEADSQRQRALLPSLGARWRATEEVDFRANVGRTYRTPDLDELYLDTETLRGNPRLRPERAWVGDLTAGFSRGSGRVALTGFAHHTRSAIVFLPVTAYLVEATNIQGTLAAGAEASTYAYLGRLALRGSYTFTHARFVESSEPVPLQPEHQAFGQIGYDVAGYPVPLLRLPDRLEIWTRGSGRSRIYLDNFGNQTAPAYVFWDAGVTMHTGDLETTFAARNLLDHDRAVDALQQPLPGRSFWLSALVRWEEP